MGSLDTTRGTDKIQDAAGSASSRVSSLADQVGEQVSSVAEGVQKGASNALTTAKEKGAAASQSAQDLGVSVRDAIAESARNQPMTTVAISIGMGFLLGSIWKAAR